MLFQNDVTMSPETVRLCLANLIAVGNFDHRINTCPRIRSTEHPFGLPAPGIEKRIGEAPFSIIGNLGGTDSSVNCMKKYIMMFLKPSPDSLTYLRVIHVLSEKDQPDEHDVYFEIGFYGRLVFICGGCTDCVGSSGGEGKLEMDRLFTLLAYAYKRKVENIEVGCVKGKEFRDKMFKRGM